VAVIQKYRHGLSEPSGGKDQVNSVVSIDIARLDQEAACRRVKLNGLLPDSGELELNPVTISAGGAAPSLNAG
jgi:hypothetical protein